jgi:polyisoprenoid-binding protein YceI
MKPFVAFTATAAVLSIVACGPSEAEIAAAKEKAMKDSLEKVAAMEKTYTVDAGTSTVRWQGNMTGLQAYNHFGNIGLNGGSFMVKGGMVTGGSFEVNMKAISPMDEGYSAEHPKEGLIGHLSGGDFFAVDSFPTAMFKITSVDGTTATGELTVRGKTNTEKVTDIAVSEAAGVATVKGKLVFDRQKYGAAYTAAKDMLLADDIELTVELSGKAQ